MTASVHPPQLRLSSDWPLPNEAPERCTCEVPGCGRTTRHFKPYCSVHLLRLPYAQRIRRELAEAERERARARRDGAEAIDPEGLVARDLLQHLQEHGVRTSARLARDLNLDHELVLVYLQALRRAGRLSYPAGPRSSRRRHRGRPVELMPEALRNSA